MTITLLPNCRQRQTSYKTTRYQVILTSPVQALFSDLNFKENGMGKYPRNLALRSL